MKLKNKEICYVYIFWLITITIFYFHSDYWYSDYRWEIAEISTMVMIVVSLLISDFYLRFKIIYFLF